MIFQLLARRLEILVLLRGRVFLATGPFPLQITCSKVPCIKLPGPYYGPDAQWT